MASRDIGSDYEAVFMPYYDDEEGVWTLRFDHLGKYYSPKPEDAVLVTGENIVEEETSFSIDYFGATITVSEGVVQGDVTFVQIPAPSPIPVEGSLFGFEDSGDVWLCCRMTDGTVRSLNGVTGNDDGSNYIFAFNPSPLPLDVTSPDEIGFEWSDGSQPTLPTIDSNKEITNFSVEGGVARYEIAIYADGVRLSLPGELSAGATSPLTLTKN